MVCIELIFPYSCFTASLESRSETSPYYYRGANKIRRDFLFSYKDKSRNRLQLKQLQCSFHQIQKQLTFPNCQDEFWAFLQSVNSIGSHSYKYSTRGFLKDRVYVWRSYWKQVESTTSFSISPQASLSLSLKSDLKNSEPLMLGCGLVPRSW